MKIQYPYGAGTIKLVSTDWLSAHLADMDLMILDVQPNIHDYVQEHIPGAFYLNEGLMRTYLKDHPARWVPPEVIQPVLRGAGIRADKAIVVYTGKGAFKGWGDGLEQTMMAYSIYRYGHEQIYVLDGGLDKWKGEGKPLTGVCPYAEPSDFTVKLQGADIVGYEEFKAIKDRKDVLVLDARPPDVYTGQGPWMKPGHIPGAVNLPWKSLMNGVNTALLKPHAEIQALLDQAGAWPDKTIICSCGTGREATNQYLLFKHYLGYPNVRLHEGAFTEWVSHPENPTVTGPNPQ
jgi:thiosulfate/3-mercaptopyruvate sulfurtransferase